MLRGGQTAAAAVAWQIGPEANLMTTRRANEFKPIPLLDYVELPIDEMRHRAKVFYNVMRKRHTVQAKGAFFTAREVGLQFIKQGTGGRIINMASQMSEVGFFKRSAYCSSKAAVVAFTKVLALEWADHRIRVNAVSPTFIESPLARKIFEDRQIAHEIMRRLPLRRLGRMEGVAAACIYLASEGADLVTGHNLLVDGGWTAQ
jgi:NAD(P)-dependent dehydrogenase (short-subunit alcohol dehydrogenase family)